MTFFASIVIKLNSYAYVKYRKKTYLLEIIFFYKYYVIIDYCLYYAYIITLRLLIFINIVFCQQYKNMFYQN
ncbi:hypothetical protein A9496_03675 [Brachyspira hampsonii]|nr:hypothetical protein H263_00515 [Brachyspira hampsonii 30599]OEJ19504.1 hypothetical protein A9496_03675 [Brachyspira hampsonii]